MDEFQHDSKMFLLSHRPHLKITTVSKINGFTVLRAMEKEKSKNTSQ